MEYKIEIKQVFRFFMISMAIVLLFGNAAVGFTHSDKDNMDVFAENQANAHSLASEWIQTNWTEGNNFFNLYSSHNKVFVRIWDSFNGGRMFLTTNDGTSWTQIDSADSSLDILSIITLDSSILAGTWDGFIQSTDDGTSWNAFTPTGIPLETAIWSIAMINSTLYAGTTGGIYKSSDKGDTWTEISSGIDVDARITSFVASGDNIFAGSAGNGVFKLTSNETSWTTTNSDLADTHISQLVAFDNKLFAVTLTGVFISENSGTSWVADPSALRNVNCIVAVNDKLIAGTDGNGAFVSADKGVTWSSYSPGMLYDNRIWSLAVCNDSIFAGTSSGIWVVGSSSVVVNVEEEISVPSITLKQNYPNPFNTSTNISFSIPSKSFVTLKIYDRLGREVATIFSEEIAAGHYTRKWNAGNTPSGIYFYRLQAGSFTETKKLILLP
ncbi:MAG: T9SS type A sorting domain-containing protein [Prolixibacteraceae bacterium]|nr:T9SS type A sorting domain-containing protein [Prolixibacteraceae bacterium]